MQRAAEVTRIDSALGNRIFLARAACEGLAGGGLLVWVAWRRERLPAGRQWAVLLVLAAVMFAGTLLWRPYVDGLLYVHYVRATLEGMVLIVAPMWLALLSGLRVTPDTVPRQTVGAALAGLAGYCFLLQEADLVPRLDEAPALLLCCVQAMAAVFLWSYARRVLAGGPVLATAGAGLLMSACVHAVAAAAIPNEVAREFTWTGVWLPLASATGTTAFGGWLWYWLLLRVRTAVFCMQALTLWLSAGVVGFAMFGFLSLRLDLSLLLGLSALVTAVRAREEDEEPIRLRVADAGQR